MMLVGQGEITGLKEGYVFVGDYEGPSPLLTDPQLTLTCH